MKHAATALFLAAAAPAAAQPDIDALCGRDAANEAAGVNDVTANPAGYYIHSLGVELRTDDPRIVKVGIDGAFLCTRTAANPAMAETASALARSRREVKYLFVPTLGLRSWAGF